MYKIAFSGIPAVGKTTLVNKIKDNYKNFIIGVPEAARMVLNSIPIEFKNNRRLVQASIFTTTYSLEKYAEKNAKNKILVLDRTLFDNLIFSKIYKAYSDKEIKYFIDNIIHLYESNDLKTIDLLIILQIKDVEKFVNAHKNDYEIFFKDKDRKYINTNNIIEFYKNFINLQEKILNEIVSKTNKFAKNIINVYLDDFNGETIYEIFEKRNVYIIDKVFNYNLIFLIMVSAILG